MSAKTLRSSDRVWLLAVAMLSLPAVVFVLSHGLYTALGYSRGRLPDVLEPPL